MEVGVWPHAPAAILLRDRSQGTFPTGKPSSTSIKSSVLFIAIYIAEHDLIKQKSVYVNAEQCKNYFNTM
jgi:hypothetical protein